MDKNKVSQEQVDKYVAETLQPLVGDLIEYAKGTNIPAGDFYLACASLTIHALEQSTGPKIKRVRNGLRDIMSEFVTETVGKRMEEATPSQEGTT
jgi:hypothetical protein